MNPIKLRHTDVRLSVSVLKQIFFIILISCQEQKEQNTLKLS